MTNDPEAIRAALEPHGWTYNPEFGFMDIDGEGDHHYCTEDEMLELFLLDNSLTGARIADLEWVEVVGDYESRSGNVGVLAQVTNNGIIAAGAMGDTPDEAIARLWLKVKGLEDPRGDA